MNTSIGLTLVSSHGAIRLATKEAHAAAQGVRRNLLTDREFSRGQRCDERPVASALSRHAGDSTVGDKLLGSESQAATKRAASAMSHLGRAGTPDVPRATQNMDLRRHGNSSREVHLLINNDLRQRAGAAGVDVPRKCP
jgi:hypothetical protein